MTTTALPSLGTAWCPTCRRRTEVVDQGWEGGDMTYRGEVEHYRTALACGHEVQGGERVVTAAPGAPCAEVGPMDPVPSVWDEPA